jgi:hypothetical protein
MKNGCVDLPNAAPFAEIPGYCLDQMWRIGDGPWCMFIEIIAKYKRGAGLRLPLNQPLTISL